MCEAVVRNIGIEPPHHVVATKARHHIDNMPHKLQLALLVEKLVERQQAHVALVAPRRDKNIVIAGAASAVDQRGQNCIAKINAICVFSCNQEVTHRSLDV